MTQTRDDIEMLLAASREGELTAAQRAEVDRLISQDAEARRMAAAYARLAALLKSWRPLPMGIDWRVEAGEVAKHVRAGAAKKDATAGLDGLERLVPHWSGAVPPVDYRAFRARVSAAVRHEAAGAAGRGVTAETIGRIRTRRRALAWIGRVGAPLAVAAAIAMAVWLPRDGTPSAPPGGAGVSPGTVAQGTGDGPTNRRPKDRTVLVSLDTPESVGSVTVKLHEAQRDKSGPAEPRGWASMAGDRGDWHAADYSVDPFLY
jgi:hypothetical protein